MPSARKVTPRADPIVILAIKLVLNLWWVEGAMSELVGDASLPFDVVGVKSRAVVSMNTVVMLELVSNVGIAGAGGRD